VALGIYDVRTVSPTRSSSQCGPGDREVLEETLDPGSGTMRSHGVPLQPS
jgi:hypothetical protein